MKKVGIIIIDVMQSESFADILKDIAQIFFASLFIGSLMGESVNSATVLLGLLLSLMFWAMNIVILKIYN